jgi:oligogalacturonide lyase
MLACYYRSMRAPRDRFDLTRRAQLAVLLAAPAAWSQSKKGEAAAGGLRRYSDPATELEVIRLTDPTHSSTLPAAYNRAVARGNAFLLLASDPPGSQQAFRVDLKSGETRQLTAAEGLDAASLTMTPDNRAFCYCAGRSLFLSNFATLRERELYQIPDDWERSPGMSVGPDGTHALIAEQKRDASRVRMVTLQQGSMRTVIEAPFPISHPQARPLRAQLLYRQADEAVWLVNMDGQQNRKLKLAPGRVAEPQWSNDGRTLLYLNIPEDKTQLNAIREHTPDTNTDKLVAKTSQFVSFGFNRDSSVFIGASANRSSPAVLLLLRITRRELTVCEHRASDASAVAPRFSPDSQRIFFQSDREGKPAIYSMHVERLVEKTDSETK